MRPLGLVMSSILVLVLVLCLSPPGSDGLDPFSVGAMAGVAGFSSALYAGWDKVKCQFEECCNGDYINNNLTHFQGEEYHFIFCETYQVIIR